MESSSDDVSRIHGRYSLTLINPSSHYISLVASVIVVSILVLVTFFAYIEGQYVEYRLITAIGVLLAIQLLDSKYIRRKEYSKSLHSSLFGNLVWLSTVLVGLLVASFLQREPEIFYVTEGMFLFASFRIGIYTSVLGANLLKAWAVCFIQPLVIYLAIVPQQYWPNLWDPMSLVFGIAFLVTATAWSTLTDRAGRPRLKSSHKLIQAYLASQANDHHEMETLMEDRSKESNVKTTQVKLVSSDGTSEARLVLPDIHPGPYHPIGGSNIPYKVYQAFNANAMVMHGVSGHSLNLPSQEQVKKYLNSLNESEITTQGDKSTEPVSVQINKARVVGLSLNKNAILFLSLSPHGMEDLPSYIKSDIEEYAKNRKFESVLIVDCHNAMGEEISKENGEDILKAAKSCLDSLITKEFFPLEFGYANSNSLNIHGYDLGKGGIAVLCLKINGKKYFVGWADANNMENGVREKLVDSFYQNGHTLLEICTSDTHYTPVRVRNKNGYNQFGLTTNHELITNWFLKVAHKAEEGLKPGKFNILEKVSRVKVMGDTIFEDYSKTLEKSLKITKGFLLVGAFIFITSLIL